MILRSYKSRDTAPLMWDMVTDIMFICLFVYLFIYLFVDAMRTTFVNGDGGSGAGNNSPDGTCVWSDHKTAVIAYMAHKERHNIAQVVDTRNVNSACATDMVKCSA